MRRHDNGEGICIALAIVSTMHTVASIMLVALTRCEDGPEAAGELRLLRRPRLRLLLAEELGRTLVVQEHAVIL